MVVVLAVAMHVQATTGGDDPPTDPPPVPLEGPGTTGPLPPFVALPALPPEPAPMVAGPDETAAFQPPLERDSGLDEDHAAPADPAPGDPRVDDGDPTPARPPSGEPMVDTQEGSTATPHPPDVLPPPSAGGAGTPDGPVQGESATPAADSVEETESVATEIQDEDAPASAAGAEAEPAAPTQQALPEPQDADRGAAPLPADPDPVEERHVPRIQAVQPEPVPPALVVAVVAAAGGVLWSVISPLLPLFAARRRDPLAHPARKALAEAVRNHPGSHLRQLTAVTGLGNGQAVHHLKTLVAARLVVRARMGGFVCFFPDEETATALAPAVGVLRSLRACSLLRLVDKRPGISIAQAEALCGVPRGGLYYHARRLRRAGLVSVQESGRERLLAATGAGREAALLLCARASPAAPAASPGQAGARA